MSEKEDHMISHEINNGDGLPPVRSGNISMSKEKVSIMIVLVDKMKHMHQSSSGQSSATRIKSSDYQSWDKYDVEKELTATETNTMASPQTTNLPQLLSEKGQDF